MSFTSSSLGLAKDLKFNFFRRFFELFCGRCNGKPEFISSNKDGDLLANFLSSTELVIISLLFVSFFHCNYSIVFFLNENYLKLAVKLLFPVHFFFPLQEIPPLFVFQSHAINSGIFPQFHLLFCMIL